ncbi:Putative cysteine proteinase CG12163 [Papilio xuthus]|uniref:Putative cysteine proteinase CG12163 n=1 Tax=Papilio xuthus TaxID=66420 RepID=A0A194QDG4_PAPXU|nr:Putative cysteine proteinase CG12163 [Papilio xuthus]
MKAIIYVFLTFFLLTTCLAELSEERKVQFVTSFVDYLNNLPNHAFIYDDGVLLNAQKTDENNYNIEIKVKVTSIHNLEAYTYRTCSVSLEDNGGSEIHINDDYKCEAPPPSTTTEFNVDSIVSQEKSTTTEDGTEHLPVQLDNEVQSNTAATSGEQFIAIPREKPSAPCIGCSTFVNPGAAGVEELALLGIRHLNRHEPDVKHELNSIVEVERQVQIVNGVRYILTLKVDYNNCTIDVAESCTVVKPCKITILEKPWVRLYDGSKYRGILANNCTEEWIFNDNGEVIQEENKGSDIVKVPKDDLDNEDDAHKSIPDFDKIANTGSVDDILKAIHNSDVQAQPLTEKTLSEVELKKLEEQIIPYNQFSDTSTLHDDEITTKLDSENINSQSINKIESRKKIIPNSNSFTFEREDKKSNTLNSDKKKAIDDLLNFFASVDSHSNQEEKRSKRNLNFVGGKLSKDNNDPKYKTLAEEALAKYLQISNVDEEFEVLKIEDVTVQVVSGQLTTITFQIVKKHAQSMSPQTCVAQVWEKPWLQFKDIKVTCQYNQSQVKRRKRQIPGGAFEQNPNDPKYLELANESMQKYLETTGNSRPHKVVEVEKVTTQVVSGTLTEIHFKILPAQGTGDVISCLSNVWEQIWLKKKDIDVNCQIGDGKWRSKRQIIAGGITEQNPNDPQFWELADESLQKYLQTTGNLIPHKVVEVERVTTQVVQGFMTRIYFKILPLQGTGGVLSCFSKVWQESSQAKHIAVNCQVGDGKWRLKRQVFGGKTEQNPNDPKYLELANESMQKYLETTGNLRPYKVVEVEKVTTQLVSGTMTEIHFKILPAQGTGDVISCLSKVWEQSWLKKKDIDVNCQIGDGKWRSKRQVFGGKTEQNPNASEYLEVTGKKQSNHNKNKHSGLSTVKSDRIIVEKLVRESLQKLEKSSAHKNKQRVYQIINYSSKKSSGPTSIYFDVGYTTCLKFELVNDITQCKFLNDTSLRHCVSHVWERPWLRDGKDIEVSCEERSIEEMNSENAMLIAATALKHIEAKYSHPRRQKVVKLISFGKQLIAGVHYRMTIEVGPTNCIVLSSKQNCTLVDDMGPNKICHVNVWPRPSVARFLNIRVVCDHKTRSNLTLRNQEARVLFDDFLDTYKPTYNSNETEKLRRFEIFRNNVKMIHALNMGDAGTATYGVTKFADLTHEEFKRQFLGLKPSLSNPNQIPMTKAVIPEVNLPDAFDWRQRGAVTPVKDQGSCGSCWAFSVTGNVEGQWQIKTGNLLSLSEQELVDCDKLDEGCNGGLMDNAYRAIEQMGGLELEDDYPYAGKAHDSCSYNKTLSRVTISGAVNISNNETDMAKWLVKHGPISIGINANAMQFYMGGVSHPWRMLCSPDNLDHGVLIVGYGESNYPLFHKRLPYWIVKNSWGPSWGENGYYRVYRGDGTCGLNMMASSAIV